ncbi:hypothetical protein ScPMuIL_003772 [Solemya velum]
MLACVILDEMYTLITQINTNLIADSGLCDDSPCQNDGVCSGDEDSYTCDCPADFTGTDCETDIDECESEPCENGGSCTDGSNSYTCNCVAGYTGNDCDLHGISKRGGATVFNAALTFVGTDVLPTSEGGRSGVPAFVIFVTDGIQSGSGAADAASVLQNRGVTIFAIGIGGTVNTIKS